MKIDGKTLEQALASCHIDPSRSNFTFTVTMKRKPTGEFIATHRMFAYMYREDGKTQTVNALCKTDITLDEVAENYIPDELLRSLLRKQIRKQERKNKK